MVFSVVEASITSIMMHLKDWPRKLSTVSCPRLTLWTRAARLSLQEDLLPIHPNRWWGNDAQANAIAANVCHDDPNVSVDHDLFTDTPREDKHGVRSFLRLE
jgi:hypothetical protein